MRDYISSISSRQRSEAQAVLDSNQNQENNTLSIYTEEENSLNSNLYRSFEDSSISLDSFSDNELSQDEIIQNTNLDNTISFVEEQKIKSIDLKENINVISFHQRNTSSLEDIYRNNIVSSSGTLLNVSEKLINNLYDDIRLVSNRFFNFYNKEKFLSNLKLNNDIFFDNIENIEIVSKSKSSMFSKINYGNVVKDFLRSGSSEKLGKITNYANRNLRKIVVEEKSSKQNFRLLIEQTSDISLDNQEIRNNNEFQKNYLLFNTSPNIILGSVYNESSFIYNTDKLICQAHINFMLSENFLCPNTYFFENNLQDNNIVRLEDYPIVQIGTRFTNGIDMTSFFNDKGAFSINSLVNHREIDSIFQNNTKYFHSSRKSKYTAYKNLDSSPSGPLNAYLDKIYNTSFYDQEDLVYHQDVLSPEYRFRKSNVMFLTDCRLKFGSSSGLFDQDLDTGDLSTITSYGHIPLSYFVTVGSRFRNLERSDFKYYDDDVTNPQLLNIEFNKAFITFHTTSSDDEVSIDSELYFQKRKLPFSSFEYSTFNVNRETDWRSNLLQLFPTIELNNNLIKEIIGFDSPILDFNDVSENSGFTRSRSSNSYYYDSEDLLNINSNNNLSDIWSFILLDRAVTVNYDFFDSWTQRNAESIVSNIGTSSSYLQNIVLFLEKINRVIETYTIYTTQENERRYNSEAQSRDSSTQNTTSGMYRIIKRNIKEISKLITSVIKAESETRRILTSINLDNPELQNEYSRLMSDFYDYYDISKAYCKKLFNRFVYVGNEDKLSALSNGDFNLKDFIFDYNISVNSRKYYQVRDTFDEDSSLQNFNQWLTEIEYLNRDLTTRYTYTNRITNSDIYDEGSSYIVNRVWNGRGEGFTDLVDEDSIGLTTEQQFLWNRNTSSRNLYPRFYDYLNNSILSIINGTIDYETFSIRRLQTLENYRKATAGQFQDIEKRNSLRQLTSNILLNVNSLLERSYQTNVEQKNPVRCLLDVHSFNYNNDYNERINSKLRNNFIEPLSNTYSQKTLKVNLIDSINFIKNKKLKDKNLEVKNILPLAKKLYERSIQLSKESKDYSFIYGNDNSENVLIYSIEDEIKNLIQDNTFTNNFRKSIILNGEKIKTTEDLIASGATLEGDFEKNHEDILNASSYYYAENLFKNNKTVLFKILKDVKEYCSNHSENWTDESRNFIDTNLPENVFANTDHVSLEDPQNKLHFLNFQFDSYLTNIFSTKNSFSKSKEFIERLMAYSICTQTNFSEDVKQVSEVSIPEHGKTVFREDLSQILKINKLNRESSSSINEMLFSEENIKKIRKYTVLEYKNPRDCYVDNPFVFSIDYNRNNQAISNVVNNFYDLQYPLNIWSFKGFSQNKITSICSGYDHYVNNFSFFEDFLDESHFIYQNRNNVSIVNNDCKLNIPDPDSVKVVKNLSIKKICNEKNSNLFSSINANSLSADQKNEEFVYKFRGSVKTNYNISKSYGKYKLESLISRLTPDLQSGDDYSVSGVSREIMTESGEVNQNENRYSKKEIFPELSFNENLSGDKKDQFTEDLFDYSYDMPSIDLFYFSINSENKSVLSYFNNLIINLLKYYEVDFDDFNNYDDILDFVSENSDISESIYRLFVSYCSIFKIVFDRYQSYYIYNFCSILSEEKYCDSISYDSFLRSNLLKLTKSQINNVIETFRELPRLIKDVERIYDYFIEENYDHGENILDQKLTKVDKNLIDLNISLDQIGFKSKDTDILLDLVNTCHLNDISKSLLFDILQGYYRTLSDTSSIILDFTSELNSGINKIKPYFINNNYTFEEVINNNYYLNMMSKKIQNRYFRNKKIRNNFLNPRLTPSEKFRTLDLFDSNKREELNNSRMLKRLYDKINEIELNNSRNYLRNKSFDFIKIGIPYDLISNFSNKSIFKILVYTIDHSTFDIDRFQANDQDILNIKSFYYTPNLTSIPSSFYEELNRQELKHIGYYDENESVINRFKLFNIENFILNIRLILNTNQDVVYNANSYPTNIRDFGSKIFTDHYISMFCEYYEKLINNSMSENYFDQKDNFGERLMTESFYNDIVSIKNNDFVNIFDAKKENFVFPYKGDNFRKIHDVSQEIKEKNKNYTFLEKLSKNRTEFDLYDIMYVNKFYDFFNIMIESPENKNVTYALKIEVL
jgi:hypothetical protein